MADINLLQNQLKDTTFVAYWRTRWAVWFLIGLLILLVSASTGLYFLKSRVNEETSALLTENANLKQKVTGQEQNLGEARIYQAKLSNIGLLLEEHTYLSLLLDELGKVTYKNAQYLTFDAAQDTGRIHVQGLVSDYESLAKLLLGLTTSPHLKNVRLLSAAPSSGESSGYMFSIDMTATSEIFTNTK